MWPYGSDLQKRLRCVQKGGGAPVLYVQGPQGACTFSGGVAVEYTYDPLNRLYRQDYNQGQSITTYLYDGAEPIQDYAG